MAAGGREPHPYTACGGYKWLLSPRGTAYFTINPALIGEGAAWNAVTRLVLVGLACPGWRAGR